MDLKAYYQKIRDAEETIQTAFPVILSRETGDGGKSGTAVEVSRRVAARMLVEGSATLATDEEAKEFRDKQALALRQAQDQAAAARVEVTVVTSEDLKRLRGGPKSARE